MPPRIKKAVFPVAGLGTRFFPITKSVPKEMLPIVDKPVIQYLVEEAVASGIEEIIFITAPGKDTIKEYFSPSPKLEKLLKERGKTKELKLIQSVSRLAKFKYAYQDKPLGDGHAILCAQKLIGNEPCAVIFGDDLIDAKTPALKQLLKVYQRFGKSVIALEKIPRSQTGSYGIIKPARESKLPARVKRITDLIEKPTPAKAPSTLGIIGKYIITPEALKTLAKSRAGADGELRLIDGFKNLIQTDQIYGLEMKGKRFDTGNKKGFLQATVHYARK